MKRLQHDVPARLAVVDRQELAELAQKTAQEQAWYEHHPRFLTEAYIAVYAGRGVLQKVHGDGNIVPTARFRNPAYEYRFPPYLLPASVAALGAVGRLWRQRLVDSGVSRPDLRLAATSFVRSEVYNAKLVRDGALASPKSTHCVGAAFDVDASGYYSFSPDTGLESVAHPARLGSLGLIASQLGNRLADNIYATRQSGERYDSSVTGALILVAAELHSDGMLNRIVEFTGTQNQCLHFCPNPDVSVDDWRALGAGTDAPAWMG